MKESDSLALLFFLYFFDLMTVLLMMRFSLYQLGEPLRRVMKLMAFCRIGNTFLINTTYLAYGVVVKRQNIDVLNEVQMPQESFPNDSREATTEFRIQIIIWLKRQTTTESTVNPLLPF